MMKKIRRNATKQMEKILTSITEVEYFIHDNNYKGGKIEPGFDAKQIKFLIDDLKEGFALLFEKEDGGYMVRYAGRCRWELKA